MYESKSHPLIPRAHFIRRLLAHLAAAMALVASSLFVGILGYQYFEALEWRDAFLNAAMLLGGMGPVDIPETDGGRIFAGVYALYAGLIVLIVTAIVLTLVIHRILHTFHWQEDE